MISNDVEAVWLTFIRWLQLPFAFVGLGSSYLGRRLRGGEQRKGKKDPS
jgi:hypothetical protein